MTCWTEVPDLGDINRYMKAIEKFPMLTAEEEIACVSEGEHGQLKLILSHLRLAASHARGYINYGLPFADLIQEGNIGLMEAAARFDPSHNVRLASYAIPWIRANIHEYVVKNRRIVKAATTKSRRKLFFNLGRLRNEKLAASGRNTFSIQDIEDIAKTLDVSVKDVGVMDTYLRGGDMSIDPLIQDDEDSRGVATIGGYIADVASDPINMMVRAEQTWLENDGVQAALELLNDREQFIVKQRHMVDVENQLTLHDLGAIYGVSAERIRQLEVKAFKVMRKHLEVYA